MTYGNAVRNKSDIKNSKFLSPNSKIPHYMSVSSMFPCSTLVDIRTPQTSGYPSPGLCIGREDVELKQERADVKCSQHT